MKLLTTPQGKSRRELDNATQELRGLELDKALVAKRRELVELDRLLEKNLSEKGAQNYEEEKKWQQKIRALTDEVEGLESRRKSALVPLQEREQSVQDRESALLQREERLLIKETDVETTKDLLEDKLDTVSEREQDAERYASTLNAREFTVQFKEEQVEKRLGALTQILRESFEEIESSQKESARKKALIKGRNITVSERERLADLREADFARREEAILDRYRTLQRAITEVNLNNGNNNNKGSARISDSD